MYCAHRRMIIYICTMFHENILNDVRVMERTRNVNGRTDRQMDGGHDIIRPVFDERIKTLNKGFKISNPKFLCFKT